MVAAERRLLPRAAVWSLAGSVTGTLAGMALAGQVRGAVGVFLPAAGALAGALLGFVLSVAPRRGKAGGPSDPPDGSGARLPGEYPEAEALALQGRHEEAVLHFHLAAAEHPEDPRPQLRAARIYRDALDRPEEALRCFCLARDAPGASRAQWRVLTRELIELLAGHMDQPVRALPELTRLAERAAGTPEGEWAARELKPGGAASPFADPPRA